MEGNFSWFRLITTRTMLSYGCVYAPVWLCVMCVCVVYKDHLWKVTLGGFRLITTRSMLSYGCARSGVVLVPTVGFIAFYGHTCEV